MIFILKKKIQSQIINRNINVFFSLLKYKRQSRKKKVYRSKKQTSSTNLAKFEFDTVETLSKKNRNRKVEIF